MKAPAVEKSARRRAREFVIQGIYQHWVGGQDLDAIEAQAHSVPGFHKADADLYEKLLRGAIHMQAQLQDYLTPHLDRAWAEVSPIERAILLLGAFELHTHMAAPYRVVINEAIELAKTYGGTDGHRFINGILDKLSPQLRTHEQ
jgi:N utilization substance protein B